MTTFTVTFLICLFLDSVVFIGCGGSKFSPNACDMLTCDTPPASECLDSVTLRTYDESGTCEQGECVYLYAKTSCENGCEDGACLANCANVSCGDGCCGETESACACPQDCAAECGDGCCTGEETTQSCEADCYACPNGMCDEGETACTCAADCPAVCSDGCCSAGGEDSCSCPSDCGVGSCSDGLCCASAGETTCTCIEDCGTECGDGCCNGEETSGTCLEDCIAECGNEFCDVGENACTCPADCSTECGDGCCSGAEDVCSCPGDCGAATCKDTDPCTWDTCENGHCVHLPLGHPVFFDTTGYDLSDTDRNNVFGTSPSDEWASILGSANRYLNSTHIEYLNYYVFYPYLQPFPHGAGAKYPSLRIGDSTSALADARRPIGVILPNDYLIEFEYLYEEPADQYSFNVFYAWDGIEADDVWLYQADSRLFTHDQGRVADLDPNVWHHIAIFVRADESYDLYVDGDYVVTGTQTGTGPLQAIGYLGDCSAGGPRGWGFFDNFRISSGPEVLFEDLLNENLNAWTTNGPVVLDASNPPHGDSAYWSGISSYLEYRLFDVSFAYRVSQDPTYAAWVEPVLRSLCSWAAWGDPDYRDGVMRLDGPRLTKSFAFALDNIATALTTTEIETYEECLLQKGVEELNKILPSPGLVSYPNGDALQTAAMGIGALALSCNHDMESYLNRTRGLLDELYDLQDIDGGWSEGMNYGGISNDSIMRFKYLDQKISGVAAFAHPYVHEIGRFLYHVQVPDGSTYLNFADCDVGWWYYRGALPILYAELDDPYALALLSRGGLNAGPWNLELFEPLTEADLPDLSTEIPGRNFRTIGWSTMRTSWDPDALFVAFHSGPKVGHSQLDEANFVISKQGQWLARDPGYRQGSHGTSLYDFTYGSLGHNVLLVHRPGEPLGQSPSGGRLKHFYASSQGNGFVRGEAADAYWNLAAYERLVALFPDPECVLVVDDFVVETELQIGGPVATVDFLMHTQRLSVTQRDQGFDLTHDGFNDGFNSRLDFLAPSSLALSTSLDTFYDAGDTSTLRASASYPASTAGLFVAALCTEDVAWQSFDAGSDVGLIAAVTGTPRRILSIHGASPGVGFEDLSVAHWCDVGTSGDQDAAIHSPGISLYPAEWNAPSVVDGLTVRTAPANANFYLNIPPEAAAAGEVWKVGILYRTGEDGDVAQYFGTTNVYRNVAPLVGDNSWRIAFLYTRPPYYFYNGIGPLFDLSVPITVADLWVDTTSTGDLCDVGVVGDDEIDPHTPGVSLFPNGDWDSSAPYPGASRSYSARHAGSNANFYLNISDSERFYELDILYAAPSDVALQQWHGTASDCCTSHTIAILPGDGKVRRVRVAVERDYYDYNFGGFGNSATNVIFNFDTEIYLIEIVARGWK